MKILRMRERNMKGSLEMASEVALYQSCIAKTELAYIWFPDIPCGDCSSCCRITHLTPTFQHSSQSSEIPFFRLR